MTDNPNLKRFPNFRLPSSLRSHPSHHCTDIFAFPAVSADPVEEWRYKGLLTENAGRYSFQLFTILLQQSSRCPAGVMPTRLAEWQIFVAVPKPHPNLDFASNPTRAAPRRRSTKPPLATKPQHDHKKHDIPYHTDLFTRRLLGECSCLMTSGGEKGVGELSESVGLWADSRSIFSSGTWVI